jgi:hypothetical protein
VQAHPALLTTATQARRETCRPALQDDVRFALLQRPDRWLDKPAAFPTIADLAAAIHRRRKDAGLELADAPLRLLGQDESRPGVSIWTQGEDGQRRDYLGWAWVNGAGRLALQAALFEAAPIVAIQGAA